MERDDRFIIRAGVVYQAEYFYFEETPSADVRNKKMYKSIYIVPIETTCNYNSESFKAIVVQGSNHYYYKDYVVGKIMDFGLPTPDNWLADFTYYEVKDFKLDYNGRE